MVIARLEGTSNISALIVEVQGGLPTEILAAKLISNVRLCVYK